MTIASAQQIKLITDFLTHSDNSRRPDIIVTTGMGLGEVVAKGSWAIRQELNNGRPETIIRMMAHTGTGVEVPPGEMADHATQSTPHIHLGSSMCSFKRIDVGKSDEGNIRIFFREFGSRSPSDVAFPPVQFQSFKLRDHTVSANDWGNIYVELSRLADAVNVYDAGPKIIGDRKNHFFCRLFESPGTVLFTGVPERTSQMTSARVGASWGLVQELVSGVPEYFIRLRGEYDPAVQNADGQMQSGLPVHQTWHSQHVHTRWKELTEPHLTTGGPNGDEVILRYFRRTKLNPPKTKPETFRVGTDLTLYATSGMLADDITALLRNHRGYLLDGRA